MPELETGRGTAPRRAFRAGADTSRKVAHNCPSYPATSGASSAASGCER